MLRDGGEKKKNYQLRAKKTRDNNKNAQNGKGD